MSYFTFGRPALLINAHPLTAFILQNFARFTNAKRNCLQHLKLRLVSRPSTHRGRLNGIVCNKPVLCITRRRAPSGRSGGKLLRSAISVRPTRAPTFDQCRALHMGRGKSRFLPSDASPNSQCHRERHVNRLTLGHYVRRVFLNLEIRRSVGRERYKNMFIFLIFK